MALDADRYRLTEAEYLAIFEKRIKPQLFAGATPPAISKEAVGQVSALMEGVDLNPGEAGQPRPSTGLGVANETGRMLLHQAVQSGQLVVAANMMKWGAIRARAGVAVKGNLLLHHRRTGLGQQKPLSTGRCPVDWSDRSSAGITSAPSGAA